MSDMNHGNPFFNTTIPFGTLNHEVLTIPSWFGYGQIRNNSSLIVFTTNSRRNSYPCRTWVNQEQWNQIIHTNKLQHARGIDPSDQKEMQKSKKCLGKIWEQGAHGLKPWALHAHSSKSRLDGGGCMASSTLSSSRKTKPEAADGKSTHWSPRRLVWRMGKKRDSLGEWEEETFTIDNLRALLQTG
jgi:hypothetical protein